MDCSSSRSADGDTQVELDEDEVFNFLVDYCEKRLVISDKETFI
jgi:hypothetical protein